MSLVILNSLTSDVQVTWIREPGFFKSEQKDLVTSAIQSILERKGINVPVNKLSAYLTIEENVFEEAVLKMKEIVVREVKKEDEILEDSLETLNRMVKDINISFELRNDQFISTKSWSVSEESINKLELLGISFYQTIIDKSIKIAVPIESFEKEIYKDFQTQPNLTLVDRLQENTRNKQKFDFKWKIKGPYIISTRLETSDQSKVIKSKELAFIKSTPGMKDVNVKVMKLNNGKYTFAIKIDEYRKAIAQISAFKTSNDAEIKKIFLEFVELLKSVKEVKWQRGKEKFISVSLWSQTGVIAPANEVNQKFKEHSLNLNVKVEEVDSSYYLSVSYEDYRKAKYEKDINKK